VDERIFRLLYGAQGGAFTRVAAAFTIVGEGWVVFALLPLLWVQRRRAATLALICVLTVTAGAVAVLKLVVQRVRPCHVIAGVSCLWGDAPTDYSFPSGHAAGSFAFATFVVAVVFLAEEPRTRPAVRHAVAWVLVAAATCIALSRVYLGVHFPGDVAAGACLGVLVGGSGAYVYWRRASGRHVRGRRAR
jgi:undecaprenyl-diphosphatase